MTHSPHYFVYGREIPSWLVRLLGIGIMDIELREEPPNLARAFQYGLRGVGWITAVYPHHVETGRTRLRLWGWLPTPYLRRPGYGIAYY